MSFLFPSAVSDLLERTLLTSLLVSGPDSPITQPTNRGNKLKANAQYVHEGVLGYTNPLAMYKEVSCSLSLVFSLGRRMQARDRQDLELIVLTRIRS